MIVFDKKSDITNYALSSHISTLGELTTEEVELVRRKAAYDGEMDVWTLNVNSAIAAIEYHRQGKANLRNYAQHVRSTAISANEGTTQWFSDKLSGRVPAKKPIKLARFQGQAPEFLSMAYRSRVAGDNREFIPDSHVAEHIAKVAQWMVGTNYSGILLRGGPGVGKSTMMRAVSDVFRIVDGRKIREVSAVEVARTGADDRRTFHELCDEQMLAIDDLGTEPPCIKSYGNEVSPMVDLLTERHRRLAFTIITTNLSEEEISARYGIRVYDRLRELCGFLKYGGEIKSYR